MATALDKEKDVQTCTLCLDSYTDPCTLQCKHSFCRRCITDYVKTQADSVQNKIIHCPSCHQVTRVPDPSRPVDEWAGQLQSGHVITYDVLSSPVLSESLDTRVEQDKETPVIRDVIVLEVEGVNTTVVVDYSNYCLKSFYTRNNKTCHSRLQVDCMPFCITQLGAKKVMVTVPFLNQFVIVAVIPDLVYEATINTRKTYFSLAVMKPSRLAASAYGYVDILNLQGEVLKSVTTTSMNLFANPLHLCVNKTGHLLVSDLGKKTVTCLTLEGETVWIYAGTGEGELSEPTGITTTGGGDIIVADCKLKKVIQLSESGEYVRDVLTSQDVHRGPRGICVDKHGSLYVSNGGKVLKFVFIRK